MKIDETWGYDYQDVVLQGCILDFVWVGFLSNKMLSQTAEIGKHAQCKIISRLTGVILPLCKVIPLLPYVGSAR